MKVTTNTRFKNEALMLEQVLPIWQEYPVDEFVFYDDHSTDNTVEVIKDFLGDEAVILGPEHIDKVSTQYIDTKTYNEPINRSTMYEYSKSTGSDVVISIDADELLSLSILLNFDAVMQAATQRRLYLFQYNVVHDLHTMRQDPSYVHNYRDFLLPTAHTGEFDMGLTQESTASLHSSPRVPNIDLPPAHTTEYGFIHLQSLDVRFYALKQLFYKVFEYVNYGKRQADLIEYDNVVNKLDFDPKPIPEGIVADHWEFDTSIFDTLAEERGYVDYIKENSIPELITFGEEYL